MHNNDDIMKIGILRSVDLILTIVWSAGLFAFCAVTINTLYTYATTLNTAVLEGAHLFIAGAIALYGGHRLRLHIIQHIATLSAGETQTP